MRNKPGRNLEQYPSPKEKEKKKNHSEVEMSFAHLRNSKKTPIGNIEWRRQRIEGKVRDKKRTNHAKVKGLEGNIGTT